MTDNLPIVSRVGNYIVVPFLHEDENNNVVTARFFIPIKNVTAHEIKDLNNVFGVNLKYIVECLSNKQA